jgi:hypothetical protein
VWNQPRKYFRSPPANRAYACRMSASNHVFNPSWPPLRAAIATEGYATARVMRSRQFDCSHHSSTATCCVLGEWGRGPPSRFSANKTNNSPRGLPAFAGSSRGGIWGARFSQNNHAGCRGSAAPEHKAGRGTPNPVFPRFEWEL